MAPRPHATFNAAISLVRAVGTVVPAMTLPAVRPRAQAETDREQGDVGETKTNPGHGGTSGRRDSGPVEDAGAEIAGGEPRSAELANEAGSEEGTCLCILNVPALN